MATQVAAVDDNLILVKTIEKSEMQMDSCIYIFKKRDGAIESISVDLQKRPCQHRQHWTKVPFVWKFVQNLERLQSLGLEAVADFRQRGEVEGSKTAAPSTPPPPPPRKTSSPPSPPSDPPVSPLWTPSSNTPTPPWTPVPSTALASASRRASLLALYSHAVVQIHKYTNTKIQLRNTAFSNTNAKYQVQ